MTANTLTPPPHLRDHADLYARDPRAASTEWFRSARYGLFMHYGIYSIPGRGEWVLYEENIPLDEYDLLKNDFTAAKFDADYITDMALEAGMQYVNITTRHHDSFCLFDTKATDHNSVQAPCGRDLVGELAGQCQKKGLGFFAYYSLFTDWRHPWFYPRSYFSIARPLYDPPEPRYLFRNDDDFSKYIDFCKAQLRELLTGYGPLAGLWFDPIMGYYARPDLFPMDEIYGMIRELQPHALIAAKQGATGDEDFASPEFHACSLEQNVRNRCGEESARVAAAAWEKNRSNPRNEICATIQKGGWGYNKNCQGRRTAEEILEMLAAADGQNCNLLLNTGPLPDGSIHLDEAATLREVGKHIREHGWPEPKASKQSEGSTGASAQ